MSEKAEARTLVAYNKTPGILFSCNYDVYQLVIVCLEIISFICSHGHSVSDLTSGNVHVMSS